MELLSTSDFDRRRSPVNSPHKGQWREALMFTLICARINGWVNNREAGDSRRYRAHYDVIVMRWVLQTCASQSITVTLRRTVVLVLWQPFLQHRQKLLTVAFLIQIASSIAWRLQTFHNEMFVSNQRQTHYLSPTRDCEGILTWNLSCASWIFILNFF